MATNTTDPLTRPEARKIAKAMIRAGYSNVEIRENLSYDEISVTANNRCGMGRSVQCAADWESLKAGTSN